MEQARWAEYRDANVRSCAVVLSNVLENQETMLNRILRPDKRFERTHYPWPRYQMLIRFLGAVGKVYSMLHREPPGREAPPHELFLANSLQADAREKKKRERFSKVLGGNWEAIRKQFEDAIQSIGTTGNPSEKHYLYSILSAWYGLLQSTLLVRPDELTRAGVNDCGESLNSGMPE